MAFSVPNEDYLKKLSVYDWSRCKGDDSFDTVFNDLVLRHINCDTILPFGVCLFGRSKTTREVRRIILDCDKANFNQRAWMDVCGIWRDKQGAQTWGWLIERLAESKEEVYEDLLTLLQDQCKKFDPSKLIEDRDLLDLWQNYDFPVVTRPQIRDFAKNVFGMNVRHVNMYLESENNDLGSQIWELVNFWRQSSPDSTAYILLEAMKNSGVPQDTCAYFADQLCKNKKYKLITDKETGQDEPDTHNPHKAEPEKGGAKKLTPEEKPAAAGDAASSSRSTDGLDEKLVARIKSEDTELGHVSVFPPLDDSKGSSAAAAAAVVYNGLPPIKGKLEKVIGVSAQMISVLEKKNLFKKPVVAVIDSGVHFSPWGGKHVSFLPPALESQMCGGRRPTPQDPHGTQVAQILFETNPFVDILDFNHRDLGGPVAALKEMKKWEDENRKVDIINMSFGYPDFVPGKEFEDLISELAKDRAIFCAASNEGQHGSDTVPAPATFEGCIAVGACDYLGKKKKVPTATLR